MTIFTARLVVGAFGTVALLTVTQGAIAKEAAIILGQGTAHAELGRQSVVQNQRGL
jgi:hypothetical protein